MSALAPVPAGWSPGSRRRPYRGVSSRARVELALQRGDRLRRHGRDPARRPGRSSAEDSTRCAPSG